MSGLPGPLRPLRRVLSGDKVIESRWMNRAGAQIARVLAARAAYHARQAPPARLVQAEVETLARDGIVVCPNFLDEPAFGRLRDEFFQLIDLDRHEAETHGPNTREAAPLGKYSEDEAPRLHGFCRDERLAGVLAWAERRPIGELWRCAHIERLTQGADLENLDPETELHSDIFFATHKAWFYLEDVTPEQGPLVFVKGSHRIHPVQLYHLYLHSCGLAVNGSRRIADTERRRRSLEETVLTCRRNTLVIANTFGYHRRLRGEPGRQRHAVHFFLRANPFAAHGLRAWVGQHPAVRDLLRRVRSGVSRGR